MLETLFHLWHSIPLPLRVPLDFYLGVIIMRGVVAKDITTWLEDRGFIKKKEQSVIYRTLDFVYTQVKKVLPEPGRKMAIWEHFRDGHQDTSVLTCRHGHCTLI